MAQLEVQDSLENLAERGKIVELFEKGLSRWEQISPAAERNEVQGQIGRVKAAVRLLEQISDGESQVIGAP